MKLRYQKLCSATLNKVIYLSKFTPIAFKFPSTHANTYMQVVKDTENKLVSCPNTQHNDSCKNSNSTWTAKSGKQCSFIYHVHVGGLITRISQYCLHNRLSRLRLYSRQDKTTLFNQGSLMGLVHFLVGINYDDTILLTSLG